MCMQYKYIAHGIEEVLVSGVMYVLAFGYVDYILHALHMWHSSILLSLN